MKFFLYCNAESALVSIEGRSENMPPGLRGCHYRDCVRPGDAALGKTYEELMAMGTGVHEWPDPPADDSKDAPAAPADERITDVKFIKDTLSVALRDGRTIIVPLAWYPRLFKATASQRKNWRVASDGYGIHWPDLDEDLKTEGLLRRGPAARPRRAEEAKNGTRRRSKC